MAVTNNLMTRVGMDVKGFTKGSKRIKGEYETISRKLQRSSGGISKTIGAGMSMQASALRKVIGGYAGWTAAVTAAGYAITKATKETMLEDAALGQLNFLLGENAQAFEDWADTQASAYGMAKTDAIRFGAVYANLVSVFAKDTAQATTMTEDLLKSSAVVASASGRSMTDVMERIRSGMLGNTEAIEDLGVNVQANALQETKAFKTMAKGAKNWDSIKSQTLKQQIRYYAILEQVQGRFGTELRDNVSTRMMIFQAQLKNLATNIGGIFIPVLNAVLPVLTRITAWLAAGAKVAAEFMHALFNYKPKGTKKTLVDTKKRVDDIGDSASSAAEKIKGSLAGFDKINVLSSGDKGAKDSGNQSGAQTPNQLDTGGGTAQLFDFSKKMAKIAIKIRKMLGNMFNNPTFQKYYQLFVDLFTRLGSILVNHFKGYWKILSGGAGKKFFKGLENLFKWIYPIVKFVIDMLLDDLQMLLSGMRKIFEGLLNFFGGLLTGDWATMWKGFKQILLGTLKVAWIAIQYFFGGKIFGIIGKFFGRFGSFFAKGGGTLKTIFLNFFNGIKSSFGEFFGTLFNFTRYNPIQAFKGLFYAIKAEVGKLFSGLSSFVSNTLKSIFGEKTFANITGVFTKLGETLKHAITHPFDTVKALFKGYANILIDIFNFLIRGINKIGIKSPKWAKKLGFKDFTPNIKEIPKLATGGIIDSPTVAMVGEAGKEAVMPLENNTGWISDLAKQINSQNGGGGSVIVNIGGTEVARIVAKEINRLNMQNGRSLINI